MFVECGVGAASEQVVRVNLWSDFKGFYTRNEVLTLGIRPQRKQLPKPSENNGFLLNCIKSLITINAVEAARKEQFLSQRIRTSSYVFSITFKLYFEAILEPF